jgi:hypothetical protein
LVITPAVAVKDIPVLALSPEDVKIVHELVGWVDTGLSMALVKVN